jgi:hypothetical protein
MADSGRCREHAAKARSAGISPADVSSEQQGSSMQGRPTLRLPAFASAKHDGALIIQGLALVFRRCPPRPPPMEEKRKHPRTEVNEPAYVSSGGSFMSCTVRNISAEGAAIDIENPAFVPPRFRLVMASDSSVRECQVAWIQRNRIGLTFVEATPT